MANISFPTYRTLFADYVNVMVLKFGSWLLNRETLTFVKGAYASKSDVHEFSFLDHFRNQDAFCNTMSLSWF